MKERDVYVVDAGDPGLYAKGGCYRCLNSAECVDMECAIAYEGTLALCRGCLVDAVQVLGYTLSDNSEYVEQLEQNLAKAERERDEARGAIEELHKQWSRVTGRRGDKEAKANVG